ncbi:protein translocation protein, Sec62 family protein [Metarhizium album ARSEF 1941]|uniref:Translocation protein SEC62 n=1 Tax=Metarhizium album (strain ARSEF 1941) TaxID=1081103 RepID=A0A0B2WQ45_METAS|nr:protein translocation protein, Sec62 family protein [Metarhizium album ARSEF 1941]KHN98166.1 protein translocation protein, Sec62 family protein [Metarhizium album ARSEF 1941]
MSAPPPPNGPPQGSTPMPMPGQRPTPEQIAEIQRRVAEDAEKAGMTVPEFIEHIKKQAAEQQRMRAMQQSEAGEHVHGEHCNHDHGGGHNHSHGQHQPIVPGPPNPKALALAHFLKGQDLKHRTSILNGERKDMFRVKRALRALQTPAYEKARKKNPLLPEITDRASLENAFKLLPLSMLALRVSKIEPEEGPNGKKPKRTKGQWNVRIEQQQDAGDDMYYVWLWEGSQVKRQLYAALALVLIFIIVLYPLWPLKLRLGVYYLSWGLLGLLGLFFLMAIFRVILFCVTYFAVPPGLWLYPNLWEDVSFMDSFRPVWAWHESAADKKKKKKKARSAARASTTVPNNAFAASTGQVAPTTATTTGTDTQINVGNAQQRQYEAPRVEELADDD